MTPGRRFPDWRTDRADPTSPPFTDYDAFFAHGPGAWLWRIDAEARRAFIFLAPAPGLPPDRAPLLRIWTLHAPNNWARPGPVSGWDGSIEAPTFSPSINYAEGCPDAWHGFIRAGRFEP